MLHAGAAYYQEGGSGWSDAPEDRPHVDSGIAAARRYIAQSQIGRPNSVFGVANCPATTNQPSAMNHSAEMLDLSQIRFNHLERLQNDTAWRDALLAIVGATRYRIGNAFGLLCGDYI